MALIADLKEMALSIYECETLLIWRRKRCTKTFLQCCSSKTNDD